ncbi:site-2 protease family protein [Pedosphaera parvula]|uniref:Peptidase M50 n=1 Tax=Pedosphaera parvula (strain Ellin514) TaxID=320771 RepID=B9XMN1_PEDPL|nr:site-2 protease family protein [Pedosphaera parvula]EEF58930.1 peptidase M50 [Pedosphaera parvula Ellin514]
MLPTKNGSIRLFKLAGITVFLHWSWFIAGIFLFKRSGTHYSSLFWNFLEYVSLFLIVLMHEFGHSLACRSVGGNSDQIVLWPLGGVAYVDPPQRPGAMLWSIAAGPMVNVMLVPILLGLSILSQSFGWYRSFPDVATLIAKVSQMNIGLLIFNMLPIYPLDGGQIFRSLLWFIVGRARSLFIASICGLIGMVGLIGLLVLMVVVSLIGGEKLDGSIALPFVLGVFVLLICWRGLMEARLLSKIDKLPRRKGFACPSCHTAPPWGAFWVCGNCRSPFDTFETNATCPRCAAYYGEAPCLDCGHRYPIHEWFAAPPMPPKAG